MGARTSHALSNVLSTLDQTIYLARLILYSKWIFFVRRHVYYVYARSGDKSAKRIAAMEERFVIPLDVVGTVVSLMLLLSLVLDWLTAVESLLGVTTTGLLVGAL